MFYSSPMSDWDRSVDLVVVGSGAGGLTTALTASLEGAEALVLEKSQLTGGTSAMSGGAIWVPNNHLMREAGLDDSEEAALRYLMTITEGRTPEAKLRTYLASAREMVRYLADRSHVRFNALTKYPDYYPEVEGGRLGGRSIEAEPFDGRRLGSDFFTLRPPHPQECIMGRVMLSAAEAHDALFSGKASQALVIRKLLGYFLDVWGRVRWRRDTRLTIGNALIGRLLLSLKDRKVPLWLGTRVRELVTENGRVVGVVAERDGKVLRIQGRKGVVLAAGGFARNASLRAEHQPAPSSTEWTAAIREDLGEGITLGRDAGAAVELLDEAWWTPTTVVPGETVPWILVVEKSLPGTIMVNKQGRRFTNEAAPYIDVVKGMQREQAASGGAIPAYLILDARCRRKYPLGPILPGGAFPESLWKKQWSRGWVTKAATLGELATKLGVDREGLEATVATFNGYATTGKDLDFGRGDSAYDRYYANPRCKPNPSLAALDRAPFYSIPVWPGDLGTKGGLLTDDSGRVQRPGDGGTIDGLFATGNTSASVMGPTYPGAGGTLGPAMTFGYLAAKAALGRLPSRRRARAPGSAPLEVRLALLCKRARPLLRVLGREDGPANLELPGERLALRQPLRLLDRPLDRLHRERAVRSDQLGRLPRGSERLSVVDHPADEPDLQRLFCGEVAPRQQQLHRNRVGDLASEPDGRAAQGEQPPPGLGEPELRAPAHDPDVCRLEYLGAARHGRPLDRGNDGLGETVAAQQCLPRELGAALHPACPLVVDRVVHRLQIGARTEVPGRAREDDHADLRIGVDHVPGVSEAAQHLVAECVARLWAVHGDSGDVAVALDEDMRGRHEGRLLRWGLHWGPLTPCFPSV
jgi:3-oxosteroid 1-dehydrogenase